MAILIQEQAQHLYIQKLFMLKTPDPHSQTFCRSLLVCIHDNTAVPTNLMQAVLPTDQTQLLSIGKNRSNPPGFSRDTLGWNKEQRKTCLDCRCWPHTYSSEWTEINANGHPCFQGKNPYDDCCIYIWYLAFKYTHPNFTSLLAFHSNSSILNRIQQKCLSTHSPKKQSLPTQIKLEYTLPLPNYKFSAMPSHQIWFSFSDKRHLEGTKPWNPSSGIMVRNETRGWAFFSFSALFNCLVFFPLF